MLDRGLTKDQAHRTLTDRGRRVGTEDLDTNDELTSAQARKLLSYVLTHGEVVFSGHARREMSNDEMTDQDVFNVLRAGRIHEPGELVRETWRYRCHTNKFCVVVTFEMSTTTVVVTAWRKK